MDVHLPGVANRKPTISWSGPGFKELVVCADIRRNWATRCVSWLLPLGRLDQGTMSVSRGETAERRAHEFGLRASEERFRLMVEAVQDYAILMLDPDGNVATWNLGAQRLKGYEAEEIIGRHFSIFYPPSEIAAG